MAERFRPIDVVEHQLVIADTPDLEAKRAENRARVAAEKDSPKYHSKWVREPIRYEKPIRPRGRPRRQT